MSFYPPAFRDATQIPFIFTFWELFCDVASSDESWTSFIFIWKIKTDKETPKSFRARKSLKRETKYE